MGDSSPQAYTIKGAPKINGEEMGYCRTVEGCLSQKKKKIKRLKFCLGAFGGRKIYVLYPGVKYPHFATDN